MFWFEPKRLPFLALQKTQKPPTHNCGGLAARGRQMQKIAKLKFYI
jgi:hypothetical protein